MSSSVGGLTLRDNQLFRDFLNFRVYCIDPLPVIASLLYTQGLRSSAWKGSMSCVVRMYRKALLHEEASLHVIAQI